jgi:large subunit ribosomal protein L41
MYLIKMPLITQFYYPNILKRLPLGSPSTSAPCRTLTVTGATLGRRTRDPYDKRWGIHPEDVKKKGGTKAMALELSKRTGAPQLPGYYNKAGKFVLVQEMIPEFVVPDLKGFKLQPYVSYRVPDVHQKEFSAKDLFDATYGKELVDEFTSGKLDIKNIDARVAELKLKKLKQE